MPPKQIPPTASVPNPPGAVNPATAAAIAAVAASTAAKKAPLKRKSSTGSTDSKAVAKKKTSAKAAKPGAAKAAAIAMAKDDKKKATPKSPATVQTSTSSIFAASIAAKSASPAKSATTKAKPKPTATLPTQQSKSQKIQQIKRDLANLDSIEKAFKQDREVWCPTEPSGGWMYRTGAAGLGAQSYMKAAKHAISTSQRRGTLFDETVLLENALRHNNLTPDSLTPQAYTALIEQARRYALELLVDAQDYAQHASRSTVASITPSDLRLAAEMRGDMNGIPSTLPKFEEMAEYASEMNKKPLPPIPADCYNGVFLPPPEEQLTCRTFDVVNGARIAQKMMNGGDLPLSTVNAGLVKRSSNVEPILAKKADGADARRGSKTQGAYGAGKGRQIAIHLKGADGSLSPDKAEGTKVAQSKSEPKNKRKLTEL